MDEIATATRPRAVQATDKDVLLQPYRLGPFKPAASHRHGAPNALAGTPARQCAKLACNLLLCGARIRSVDFERGNAGADARPGLRLDSRQPRP